VRPEHASLTNPKASSVLSGTLKTVVYFGTDTHYHVELTTGGTFTVRMKNARGQAGEFSEGDKVGVDIDAGATQVLRD
jgi:spermidine/putrescine transport system ATP-binding protein